MSVEWSLDEIIQANKKNSRDNRGERNARESRSSEKRYNPYPRGNVDGKWEHDLFDKQERPKRGTFSVRRDINQHRSSTSILNVSCIPKDFVANDFQQMGKTFDCLEVRPYHDAAGNFVGQADFLYRNRNDAEAALEHFKYTKIDRIPLRLKLVENRGSIADRLEVDKPTIGSRISFPEKRNPRQHTEHREREKFNFLDRLADDKEFQREQHERKELLDLDHDMDVYMNRASSRG